MAYCFKDRISEYVSEYPSLYELNTCTDRNQVEAWLAKNFKNAKIIDANERLYVILEQSDHTLISISALQGYIHKKTSYNVYFAIKIKGAYMFLHQVGCNSFFDLNLAIKQDCNFSPAIFYGRHGGFRQNWIEVDGVHLQQPEEDSVDKIKGELIGIIEKDCSRASPPLSSSKVGRAHPEEPEKGLAANEYIDACKTEIDECCKGRVFSKKKNFPNDIFLMSGKSNHVDGIVEIVKESGPDNPVVLYWCYSALFIYEHSLDKRARNKMHAMHLCRSLEKCESLKDFISAKSWSSDRIHFKDMYAHFIENRSLDKFDDRLCGELVEKIGNITSSQLKIELSKSGTEDWKHIVNGEEYLLSSDNCSEIYEKTVDDVIADFLERLSK